MATTNHTTLDYRIKDETGNLYGNLTVLAYSPGQHRKGAHTKAWWTCRCICGRVVVVAGTSLRRGYSRSCGNHCSQVTHGHTRGKKRSPEYRCWRAMKTRCYNPNKENYSKYGGKGIEVCARWLESFQNFWDDMGPRPSLTHSIDRIDRDGDYSPANCRWATKTIQANNRSISHNVTYGGITQSLAMWARQVDLPRRTIQFRLDAGWSIERALTEPIHKSEQSKALKRQYG